MMLENGLLHNKLISLQARKEIASWYHSACSLKSHKLVFWEEHSNAVRAPRDEVRKAEAQAELNLARDVKGSIRTSTSTSVINTGLLTLLPIS